MPPDALPVRRPDPVDGRASEASGVQARPPGRARASDGAGRLWCAGAVPHRCPVSVRAVSGGSAAPPAIQAQPVWIRLRRPTGLPDPCRAARGGSAWLPGAAGGAVIRHHPAVARRPDRQLLRGGSSSSVLLLCGCSAGSSARQLGQEGGGAWPSALGGRGCISPMPGRGARAELEEEGGGSTAGRRPVFCSGFWENFPRGLGLWLDFR